MEVRCPLLRSIRLFLHGTLRLDDSFSVSYTHLEGVVYKNVIATYLHGPLLPKNPQVCDYLLERALKRKYGEEITLAPLSDDLEKKANRYIVDRYSDKKYVLKETIKRHT